MFRRSFLKKIGVAGAYISVGGLPIELLREPEFFSLTILHTNDVHSRIDPFPMDGSRRQGLGGAAKRASLIEQIRSEQEQLLLFDSGDIFQGTPYFNFFGGELEFKLMSQMKYDAATIGNHDFDAGMDGLEKQLPHADFPFVISNYDFRDTVMAGKTKGFQIFTKDEVRVGVMGLGIELKGLVPDLLYGNTLYLDPIKKANQMASFLKKDQKCDYVVCLSHLGYKYRYGKVDDVKLAQQTQDIDLILGGHTHTFLDEPDIQRNLDGKPVVINQVGWGGMKLGRIEVHFERNRKKHCVSCADQWIK
jgi:5'-nucleotidase